MHSFRSKLLPVVVSLLFAASSTLRALPRDGEEEAETTISITDSVEFHPRAGKLNDVCRTSRDVLACTDFVDEHFDCHCEQGEDGWHIIVEGKLKAVIHVTRAQFVMHERMHIADIEASIPGALQRFVDGRYTSKESCETLAGVMSLPSFAQKIMNRIRVESNERLGCAKIGSQQASKR